jgi:hypothetical protein
VGVAIGARRPADLTGGFPLTIDGITYTSKIVYRTAGSYDLASHSGAVQSTPNPADPTSPTLSGGIGGMVLMPSGSAAYGLSAFEGGGLSPSATFAIQPGTGPIAYAAVEYGGLCRGIEYRTISLAKAGGTGWYDVKIAGGLWWVLSDENGFVDSGNNPQGVAEAGGGGVARPTGPRFGEQSGTAGGAMDGMLVPGTDTGPIV